MRGEEWRDEGRGVEGEGEEWRGKGGGVEG